MGDDKSLVSMTANDLYYEQVINIHMDAIVNQGLMKASAVAACLPDITMERKKDILCLERTSLQEACHFLIEQVLKTKNPGWFRTFLNALNQAGSERLARMLEFREVKDDEFGRRMLALILTDVIEQVDADEILKDLVAQRVITRADFDQIRHQRGMEAMYELVMNLHRRQDDWFFLFIRTLRTSNYNVTCEILPELSDARSDASMQRVLSEAEAANDGSDTYRSDPVKEKKIEEAFGTMGYSRHYSEEEQPSGNLLGPNLEGSGGGNEKSFDKSVALTSPAGGIYQGSGGTGQRLDVTKRQGVATVIRLPTKSEGASDPQTPRAHIAAPRVIPAATTTSQTDILSPQGGSQPPREGVALQASNPQTSVTQVAPPPGVAETQRKRWCGEMSDERGLAGSRGIRGVAGSSGVRGVSDPDQVERQLTSLRPFRSTADQVYTRLDLNLRADDTDPPSPEGALGRPAPPAGSSVGGSTYSDNNHSLNQLSSPSPRQGGTKLKTLYNPLGFEGNIPMGRKTARRESVGGSGVEGVERMPDTIFIHGLPLDVTAEEVVEYFSMGGDIPVKPEGCKGRKVELLRDERTGGANGQARLAYVSEELASMAVEIFNDSVFRGGQPVQVEIACKPRPPPSSLPLSPPSNPQSRPLASKSCPSTFHPPAPQTSSLCSDFSSSDLAGFGYSLGGASCSSDGSSGFLSQQSPPEGAARPLALRRYQEELAERAKEGFNCIVVAPTGSGKTHVALEIVRDHFERRAACGDKPRRVVFFVPTVALVAQQRGQFNTYLRERKCMALSGDQDAKVPLSDLLPLYEVLVMTPQILENALKTKDIRSLDVFSLLIFDECHHTTKGHTYNVIMAHYIDEACAAEEGEGERGARGGGAGRNRPFGRPPSLPQVVGLTASVGVGKAKSSAQAVDHILKLCANLYAQHICTVKRCVTELRQHVNKPSESTREIQGRTLDPFNDIVGGIMKEIEDRMTGSPAITEVEAEMKDFRGQLIAPQADRGSDRYTQWIHKLDRPVASIYRQDTRRFFVACLRHLMHYNSALLINADCRTKDALEYLEREKNPAKVDIYPFSDKTDVWLDALYDDKKGHLLQVSQDPAYENPKLDHLREIVLDYYRDKPSSRGIIFCKTRDLTVALTNWMKATAGLSALNPHNLVGANAPANRAGMTQFKQEDVLKYFKDGHHRIIIATSVAEEGLDVQKCNIVIRYEHVTNSIARVQARGRARAEEAEYVLVAEKGRGTAEKEEFNKIREKMMNAAIEVIDDTPPAEIRRKIHRFQTEARVERDMASRGRRINTGLREARHVVGDYTLRCHKCDSFAAQSADIRKIEDSHHVIIDPAYKERIVVRPHPAPKTFVNFELTGKIYCKQCHWDWGIMCLYKKVPFPVVKICSFIVVNAHDERSKYNRWKEVPFKVLPLLPDDLEQQMQAMEDRELGPPSGEEDETYEDMD